MLSLKTNSAKYVESITRIPQPRESSRFLTSPQPYTNSILCSVSQSVAAGWFAVSIVDRPSPKFSDRLNRERPEFLGHRTIL